MAASESVPIGARPGEDACLSCLNAAVAAALAPSFSKRVIVFSLLPAVRAAHESSSSGARATPLDVGVDYRPEQVHVSSTNGFDRP